VQIVFGLEWKGYSELAKDIGIELVSDEEMWHLTLTDEEVLWNQGNVLVQGFPTGGMRTPGGTWETLGTREKIV
jgi:hypothetical protein